MKGIVRKINDLGRVVVPKEIRRAQGIGDHDEVEIIPTGAGILIRPVKSTCAHCGEDAKDGVHHRDATICSRCAAEFRRL